jgi:hypothetical protein
MFWQMPSAFRPDFQPEHSLGSLEEVECYKARAKAHKPRFPWSEQLLPVWNATLVHLSANVPGKVAYYASVPNMVAGRLTRTSPEMFLQRTLVYAPQEICAAWGAEVLGQTLPIIQLVSNNDPDRWYQVYRDGPNSCMAGSPRVKQYAHPDNDLALAYTETSNNITHRAIVNTKTKTYVRVYGHEPGSFIAALNKLGYRHSYDTLAKQIVWLEYDDCYRCDAEVLVGPYLDGNHQGIDRIDRNTGYIGGYREMYYGEEAYCGCEESSDDDYDDGDGDEE